MQLEQMNQELFEFPLRTLALQQSRWEVQTQSVKVTNQRWPPLEVRCGAEIHSGLILVKLLFDGKLSAN